MDSNTLVKVKKVSIVIIFIIMLIIIGTFLYKVNDNKLINHIKTFVNTNTKVLYISNKKSYSEYPINLFKKYDVEYMYINSDNLSSFEKNKLEKIINSSYLSSIIVVFENGKLEDALIEFSNIDSLIKFLSDNAIIPEVIGDNTNIISNVKDMLDTNFSIIYLPYKNSTTMESQNNIIESVSNDYLINYKKIDAFLLSKNQQNKLNALLQISNVEDQIIILVKNKKIIGSIRSICTKRELMNELSNYNFINSNTDYISYINYDEFDKIVSSNDKNVIIIGKDECKYCTDIVYLFNKMIENNDIEANYINVKNFETEDFNSVKNKLKSLGYMDGFSTPLTIIVENNKLLDYVIGISSEEYFIDIFKENGIIR